MSIWVVLALVLLLGFNMYGMDAVLRMRNDIAAIARAVGAGTPESLTSEQTGAHGDVDVPSDGTPGGTPDGTSSPA